MTTRLLALSLILSSASLAAPALGATTVTLDESGVTNVTAQGVGTWFGGMRSAEGKARGHVMGVENSRARTIAFAFGSGARMVATCGAPPNCTRRIVGGTGAYLGARGVDLTKKHGGTYRHTVTYSLPPRGTARVRFSNVVVLNPATTVDRGNPFGLGNARLIVGTILDASGTTVGTYGVDSAVVGVYGGGAFHWLLGDFVYRFTTGDTLRATGPYQRATGSAPGALPGSSRVVVGGTGRYAGMRGQVVPTPNADGSDTHAFTLLKPSR